MDLLRGVVTWQIALLAKDGNNVCVSLRAEDIMNLTRSVCGIRSEFVQILIDHLLLHYDIENHSWGHSFLLHLYTLLPTLQR